MITKDQNITKIVLIGDSIMVVLEIIKRIQSRRKLFNGIIYRILSLSASFVKFKIHHIKRDLNILVDHWDKEGARMIKGEIIVNGV